MNTQLLEKPATALSVVERAEVVLDAGRLRIWLAELVLKSANITVIKNKVGRDECHRALMVLRNTRTSISADGKTARDDATKFGKAVIVTETSLIAITTDEESRLRVVLEVWDDQELAIKAELARAEQAQAALVQGRIDVLGFDMSLVGASAVQLLQKINDLGAIEISLEVYGDRAGEAQQLQAATLEQLNQLHDKALLAEEQQFAAAAQQAKLDAERAAFEIQVRVANEARTEAAALEQIEIAKEKLVLQQQRDAINAEIAAAAKVISDKAAAEQKVLDDAAAVERARLDAVAAAERAEKLIEMQAAANYERAEFEAEERMRSTAFMLYAALDSLAFQVDEFQLRHGHQGISTEDAHTAITTATTTTATGEQS
jgi:hypothetical protein